MRHSIFNFCLAICFTVCSMISSLAQWIPKSTGLEGGRLLELMPDGSKLFAVTPAGIYISTDDGVSWNIANSEVSAVGPRCIAGSGQNLFLGTNAGVYRSTDGGFNWVKGGSEITQAVRALLVGNGKIFAGTSAGVYVSSNNGTSWQLFNNGLSANSMIWSFARRESNIYVATPMGVFETSNDAALWTQIGSGVGATKVIARGNTLFIASGEVMKTTNNAGIWSDWTSASNGLPAEMVNALFSSGNDILAGTVTGVYRSADDGASWTSSDVGIPEATRVNDFALSGSKLIAATNLGCYRSVDNGSSWAAFNSGLNSPQVSCFVSNGDLLFAGTDAGVFVSGDEGSSWQQARSNLTGTGLFVRALVTDGPKLYAATQKGMYVSSDDGSTWEFANTGLPNYLIMALVNHNGNLFVGLSQMGSGPDPDLIYTSSDGTTWVKASGNLPASSAVTGLASANGIIYASIDGSIYKSTNNGATWTLFKSGISDISVLLTNDADIYVVSGLGLSRTSDGVNWSTLNTGINTPGVASLVVSAEDIVLGASLAGGKSIRWSHDGGATFSAGTAGVKAYNNSALYLFGDKVFGGFEGDKSVWSRALSDFVSKVISFSPIMGPPSTVVTISGNNFDATPSGNTVTFNGVPASVVSSSATTLTVTVPATATSGRITVTALGQTSVSDFDFTVEQTITASEQSAEGKEALSAYPNPADNILYVELENSFQEPTHFTIFSIMGSVIRESKLTDARSNVDVSHLSPGCYIIRATNESGVYHKRFTKR